MVHRKRLAEAKQLKNRIAPAPEDASSARESALFRPMHILEDWPSLKSLLLARIVEAHAAARNFRVWVQGCAFGEETYAFAMLLSETLLAIPVDQRPRVRIFGTDTDEEGIAFARRGWYPHEIAARFPQRTRQDFLDREHAGYRIRRDVRELITFAVHDLKADPPFAKLDLVIHRDDPTRAEAVPLQALAPLFHFSLAPEGLLLFSSREQSPAHPDLFEPLGGALYRRLASTNPDRPRNLYLRNFSRTQFTGGGHERPGARTQAEAALLRYFVPPSALVNDAGDILYFTGRTGEFLDMPADQPRWNVHACVRPELRQALPAALEKALHDRVQVVLPPAELSGSDVPRWLQVAVQPVQLEAPQTALVVFREVSAPTGASAGRLPLPSPAADVDELPLSDTLENAALRREMQELREKLGLANEELQSINEELVVTNDDLRTSNDQIKAMNEALLRALTDSEESHRHIEALSHRLVSVQEGERRHLSSELHDRTSPNLASINVLLKTLGSSLPAEVNEQLGSVLDDLSALIEDTTASIREICADLRPPVLDHAGLVPALESYAQQFACRTGIQVRVDAGGCPRHLSSEHESLLFRIAQEALTNCAKHSQAERIEIKLGATRDEAILTIADDGIGFSSLMLTDPDRSAGLGLLTMRERAEFAGGRFTLDSRPGQGTRITVEIGTRTH